MGILNVTPDSFSDGGRFLDRDDAVAHGVAMHRAGADLVDVGGESTRPGAGGWPPTSRRQRVLPVIRELVGQGVPVSIDTTRAGVAEAAVEAGAAVVNDVSGGLADPRMAAAVAAAGVPWILMHWRGPSSRMNELAGYEDVIGEVRAELVARVDAAVLAGVDPARLVLDPGLGFAKTAAHNWALLRRLDVLVALGFPVLVGASRKRFLGAAAGRRRRHAARRRRGRDGDRGGQRAGRARRRLGGPGARRGRPPWTRSRWPRPGSSGAPPARVDGDRGRDPVDATGSSCAG